jgi:peptidoglycan/xylan/chitin deacetylase (PgdA/CDA1 family)
MGDNSPTARHRLHDELWRVLANSEPNERGQIVADLLRWAGLTPSARPSHRTLTAAELRSLRRGGQFEVGAHSLTHPGLAALPREMQAHELSASKARLEEILEAPVLGCSYPNGRWSEETEAETRKAGYAFACGSISKPVTRRSDLFQLPRVSPRTGVERFANMLRAHIAA